MSDPSQIPHLLQLLDDESPAVKKAVAEVLAAFGSSLDGHLAQLAEAPDADQMQKIRAILASRSNTTPAPVGLVQSEPLFQPGRLVRHRRYGYRGVVVGFDSSCQADDDWYFSNRSQPERFQPWYHVLVHGSEQVTYTAQTSLFEDESDEQIAHPLVEHFFSGFKDGCYIRNDIPWPHQGPS
jgi:heat shock protein HspQ